MFSNEIMSFCVWKNLDINFYLPKCYQSDFSNSFMLRAVEKNIS